MKFVRSALGRCVRLAVGLFTFRSPDRLQTVTKFDPQMEPNPTQPFSPSPAFFRPRPIFHAQAQYFLILNFQTSSTILRPTGHFLCTGAAFLAFGAAEPSQPFSERTLFSMHRHSTSCISSCKTYSTTLRPSHSSMHRRIVSIVSVVTIVSTCAAETTTPTDTMDTTAAPALQKPPHPRTQ